MKKLVLTTRRILDDEQRKELIERIDDDFRKYGFTILDFGMEAQEVEFDRIPDDNCPSVVKTVEICCKS